MISWARTRRPSTARSRPSTPNRSWRRGEVASRVGVAVDRPDLLTTDELLVAGGVSREQLYRWVAQRLIERATFAASPDGRPIAVWLREALERARFIDKRERQGLTPKEVADLVRERWPTLMRRGPAT